MNEDEFWLKIWQTAIIAILIVIVFAQIYFSYQTKKVVEMVHAGVNPIDAKLAAGGFSLDRFAIYKISECNCNK